jgi:hypothetical protein
MKLFRISNVLILIVATILGGSLFWTSQMVQEHQDELASLTAQITVEQEAMSVLGAEWDYLNRPQRLEQLAREYLSVQFPKEDHILADARVIAEPSIPTVPPSKPALIPAMIKRDTPVQSAPPAVIHQADSEKFDALLQNLSGGDE